jgi:hypothetical protein
MQHGSGGMGNTKHGKSKMFDDVKEAFKQK